MMTSQSALALVLGLGHRHGLQHHRVQAVRVVTATAIDATWSAATAEVRNGAQAAVRIAKVTAGTITRSPVAECEVVARAVLNDLASTPQCSHSARPNVWIACNGDQVHRQVPLRVTANNNHAAPPVRRRQTTTLRLSYNTCMSLVAVVRSCAITPLSSLCTIARMLHHTGRRLVLGTRRYGKVYDSCVITMTHYFPL